MANPDGTPVWFELNTPDLDTAQSFYADVMGWTVAVDPDPQHGGYRLASAADGVMVAGMMAPPPGMPAVPGWSIYFGTGDVDATAEKVKALGGYIQVGPMDIPGVGRFAVAMDPQRVTFFLMTGNSPEASKAFLPGPNPGHGVWIELATPDPDGAFDFYGKLFGWTKEGAMPMGEMGEYAFLGAGDARPGAIMSSETTGAPARWNSYIYVPDIDAAVATAMKHGGVLRQGPDPIPGGDYSANVADPGGMQIGLVGPRKGDGQ